jgi:hypothetical protein
MPNQNEFCDRNGYLSVKYLGHRRKGRIAPRAGRAVYVGTIPHPPVSETLVKPLNVTTGTADLLGINQQTTGQQIFPVPCLVGRPILAG